MGNAQGREESAANAMQDQVMNVPPYSVGASNRGTSVRRRLSLTDAGLSPKAQRPHAYVQPPPTQHTAPLDVGALTNEMINQKHAINQVHAWVTHSAECVTNHANMIDEANTEAGVVRGKLAAYERQLGEGFQAAEERLTGTFAKVDELIGQLRAETNTTATQL